MTNMRLLVELYPFSKSYVVYENKIYKMRHSAIDVICRCFNDEAIYVDDNAIKTVSLNYQK